MKQQIGKELKRVFHLAVAALILQGVLWLLSYAFPLYSPIFLLLAIAPSVFVEFRCQFHLGILTSLLYVGIAVALSLLLPMSILLYSAIFFALAFLGVTIALHFSKKHLMLFLAAVMTLSAFIPCALFCVDNGGLPLDAVFTYVTKGEDSEVYDFAVEFEVNLRLKEQTFQNIEEFHKARNAAIEQITKEDRSIPLSSLAAHLRDVLSRDLFQFVFGFISFATVLVFGLATSLIPLYQEQLKDFYVNLKLIRQKAYALPKPSSFELDKPYVLSSVALTLLFLALAGLVEELYPTARFIYFGLILFPFALDLMLTGIKLLKMAEKSAAWAIVIVTLGVLFAPLLVVIAEVLSIILNIRNNLTIIKEDSES